MPALTNPVRVRKNTGELVDFDVNKLRGALARSGAGPSQIKAVVEKLSPMLYDGITTHKIYQIAYAILKKTSWRAAGRYRLKKAMLELGPTGYPFEQFIAMLLEHQGYEVQVGRLVEGHCVTHEVDVLATKSGKKMMVECKYHSDKSTKSDVKVPLYIYSRFLDLKKSWTKEADGRNTDYDCMIVTNSRFTGDASNYGNCAGIKMVSWDAPDGNSLKDWIDRSGFHPITVLHSLKKSEKKLLLEKGIVLCRQIAEQPEILDEIVYPSKKITKILTEIKSMLD
jgi:Holliday junction resolvase-like predicted endonuclease